MSDDLHRPRQMAPEDAEEYTAALGQIMSGGWRQIALAQHLGVPAALGMTTEAWVSERIGGYVRLGLDERREAVRKLTDPDGAFHLTQREAADVLGVDQTTVSRDLRVDADASDDPPPPGEDDDPVDASASTAGWAELSVEAGLADIDWERPDADEDGEPEQPTMGEILGGEPLVFDDSGLIEAAARRKRYEHANTVLDELIDLTTRYGPEVLVEHERPEGMSTLARTLAPLIAWLTRAHQLASDPRTQIRSLS